MEKRIPRANGLCRWAVRLWFALSFRKIRLLHTRALSLEGPTLLAVSHPASFLEALILATAFEQPVHCLVPRNLVNGPLAGFLARGLSMVLDDYDGAVPLVAGQSAANVLVSGGALVVFADQSAGPPDSPRGLARSAASLIARVESQLPAQRVAVCPVHLFLPLASSQSHELLIHVDSPLARPKDRPGAGHGNDEAASLASLIEQSFRAHAFQLRPADLDHFCTDLEAILQAGLREDWASRPNWKQDIDGFVLSGFVAEWVRQTNHVNPGGIVALRESVDEYRHLLQLLALRQLEVETAGALLQSGWRRTLLWLETLIGLPFALYGALNHLAIGALLFLTGSFKNDDHGNRTRLWIIRGAIVLIGYAAQIFLVAHRWGRAAAGYYAPTLPLTGAYLWRYLWLLRHRTRLLFLSLTIAVLASRAKRVRGVLLEKLDQTLVERESKTGAIPGAGSEGRPTTA